MNTQEAITNKKLLKAVETYWKWRWLWMGTTFLFGIAGFMYVVFLKHDVYVASQGLLVRDEANGAVMRLGRFQSQTEMKAAQETILEMARNSQVLKVALEKIGPKPSWLGWLWKSEYPTSAEIEQFARYGIGVRAPRGAELGTTEVIYLDTRDADRERAFALNNAVCDALETHLQEVRRIRADGVIGELTAAREIARRELDTITQVLQEIESGTGADLSDLRGMTDAGSVVSNTRMLHDSIKSELRQAELQQQQLNTDIELVREAVEDLDNLLTAPSELLNGQPGLKKLREGLADASLNASQLRSRFTESHPMVVAALEAENQIEMSLRAELDYSQRTLVRDQQLLDKKVEKLRTQLTQLETRMEKLASIRADYSNLAGEVKTRSQILQDNERKLAEAQAARDAAISCSLITRFDKPMVGAQPEGPGRKTIFAGTTMAGLFFGLGVVFLLTPLDGSAAYGRRRSDHLNGRRTADMTFADAQVRTTAVNNAPVSSSPAPVNRSSETVVEKGSAQPAKPPFRSAVWQNSPQTTPSTPVKSGSLFQVPGSVYVEPKANESQTKEPATAVTQVKEPATQVKEPVTQVKEPSGAVTPRRASDSQAPSKPRQV